MPDNNFQDNTYLAARKEYGDRYGSAVKDAARWRQISIVSVAISPVRELEEVLKNPLVFYKT